MLDVGDTIVAIASASGGAARGIVRLSGPRAVEIAAGLTVDPPCVAGRLGGRGATVVSSSLDLADSGTPPRLLPVDLFLWPGNRSYTREPTAELHLLGSPPLLDVVVVRACARGARLAEAGEFTLRAFLSGRIDLTQAEAVLGVIDARSDQALHTALAQLAGGMAAPLTALREELLRLLAELEAGLDFADEDIEFISAEVLASRLAVARDRVAAVIDQLEQRGDTSVVPRVVLVGRVNAGKSSLFNALVRRQGGSLEGVTAIVSPRPGATRDYLTARMVSEGIAWELVDTAGVEPADSAASITSAAQSMTRYALENAALLVVCHDVNRREATVVSASAAQVVVVTKGDRSSAPADDYSPDTIVTSSVTGAGLDQLEQRIIAVLEDSIDATTSAMVGSTAVRSEASLRGALDALDTARQLAAQGESEELVAAELRCALDALGQVAGAVYTDDVLDRVFSQFCIGK